jgi:hypothetical protein
LGHWWSDSGGCEGQMWDLSFRMCTSKPSKNWNRRVRPNRNPRDMLIQHDNAFLHTVYKPRRQSPNLFGLYSPIPPIVLM